MASAAAAASTSAAEAREKPVVVRVKRKPSQARPDAFWLEINERPMKKAMLDFSSLSISQSSLSTAQASEEPRVKKLLVQHVETVHHSGAVEDVLHSLLHTDSSAKEIKSKTKEWNERMKKDNKQDQLRSAARQRHENLGRNARFAQIWKSRKGDNNETDETLREMCHLYDAVQVDSDGEKHAAEPEMTSFEESAIFFHLYGSTCHRLLKKLNQTLFRWHIRKIQMFMTYILSRKLMMQTWRRHQQLHTRCYKWTMMMVNATMMMSIHMIQMIQMLKTTHSMIILRKKSHQRMRVAVTRILLRTLVPQVPNMRRKRWKKMMTMSSGNAKLSSVVI